MRPPHRPTVPIVAPRPGPDAPAIRFRISAATLALVLAGCGRSAPPDALGGTGSDPEIAGISITSPGAVISTVPGAPQTASTSTSVPTSAPLAVASRYIVQSGDTLSSIATEYGITIDALARANGIADVDTIKPGQELAIPAAPVEVSVVTEPQGLPQPATTTGPVPTSAGQAGGQTTPVQP